MIMRNIDIELMNTLLFQIIDHVLGAGILRAGIDQQIFAA